VWDLPSLVVAYGLRSGICCVSDQRFSHAVTCLRAGTFRDQQRVAVQLSKLSSIRQNRSVNVIMGRSWGVVLVMKVFIPWPSYSHSKLDISHGSGFAIEVGLQVSQNLVATNSFLHQEVWWQFFT
jgi:hypothetical protein